MKTDCGKRKSRRKKSESNLGVAWRANDLAYLPNETADR